MRGSRTRRRVTTTRTSPGSLPRLGAVSSPISGNSTGPRGSGSHGGPAALAGPEALAQRLALVAQQHAVGRLDAPRVAACRQAEHAGGPAAHEPDAGGGELLQPVRVHALAGQ